MDAAWRALPGLVRRELRGGLKGFRIFVACLALGVGAIATVGSITSAVVSGLARDARSLLGGDLSIRLFYRDLNPQEQTYLRQNATNLSGFIEMRAMARFDKGDSRTLVQVKAADESYPLVGRVSLIGGGDFNDALALRDGVAGAVVQETLGSRLGVTVGDLIEIGEAKFRIGAFLEKEPDRAGAGIELGPRVLIARSALAATGLLQPGGLVEYHTQALLKPGLDPTLFAQELQRAFPESAWRVRNFRQATPSIERFVQRISLFLTLVGLTALLVGGVGVGNAVRAYLDSKTTTIATLKCLGATGGMIFGLYFTLVMILALVGSAIGLAFGAASPWIAGALLGANLPTPLAIGIYPLALAQAVLFGLLSAAAFSIWPLAMAREVRAAGLFRAAVASGAGRPKLAYVIATGLAIAALAGLAIATAPERKIAIWFVIGSILCFILFRLAGQGVMALARRAHATGPRLRLALGNLHRPGAATPSVVMSLGLGLTVLVTVATIEGNVTRQISDRLPARAPSFFFLDIQPDQVAAFDKLTSETPGVHKVDRAPALRGRITRLNGVPVAQANVAPDVAWALDNERGLTYAAQKPDNAKVVAGEWWPANYAGPPQISFDGRLAAGMGLALGDKLTVNVLGRDVDVTIANLREVDYQSLGINFAIIFAPGLLERAPHTHIATVYADPPVEADLLRAVTKAFPNVSGIRVKDALESIAGVLGGIGSAARATSMLTLLAGTLVLVGAIAAGQRRRRQDAVVLKVLGATRADVVGALLLEYGALGALTAMVAAVVGTVAGWAVVTQVMRAEWAFLPGTVAAVAVLCAALTVALGLVGAWRALGQKAAPILREA